MAELQDNTTEMQSKHTASSQPKKAKGSALDRGFPTGTVLILLVIIVITLQGISAWKVINLESERAAIEKKGALLEKDLNDFEKLMRELPVLKEERDQLKKDIPELEGTKNNLIIQVANLERQLAQARETIERSKEAEKIKIDLEKAANEFKTEIENKTAEIKRLASPNSLIQKSAGDLKILINNLDKAPEQLNQFIIQAKRQINSSLNTINNAATSLQAEVTSFSSTSKAIVADLQSVSETANNAVNSIKEAEKILSQQTENLSESSKQFATQINAIDNNLENLINNNQKLSNEATEVTRITTNINSTADKFKELYADKEQAFNKFNESTSSLAAQLKTEIESFKTTAAWYKTKNEEFLNNTKKIGSTATDLNMATEKVKKFSSEAGALFRSLKDYTVSLESVIGNLTANSSLINNAGKDLQRASNGLGTSVNKISQKIDIIERDASDFSRKIETFDPSKVEDAIKDYASQLSKNMEIILSGSDNLSNLNQNVERMLYKLQNEIESFNQLLQKQRKSLIEVQETSSNNKSD